MRDICVLLTGLIQHGVYGICESLRNNGERNVRLVGCDCDEEVFGRQWVDAFYRVAPYQSDVFREQVCRIIREERVDVVLPLSATPNSIRALEMLPAPMANTRSKVVDKLSRKDDVYTLLADMTCIPRFRVVSDETTLGIAAQQLGYPDCRLCLKPVQGTAGEGVIVLDKYAPSRDFVFGRAAYQQVEAAPLELVQAMFKHVTGVQLMLMEHLPGVEWDVDVLAGEPNMLVPRRCDRLRWAITWEGEVMEDSMLVADCDAIVRRLGLRFLSHVSFRERADGTRMLLEVHPRVAASIDMSVAAGVNLPYFAVKKALSEQVAYAGPKWGTKFVRYFGGATCE